MATKANKPVPQGFHTVTPSLTIRGAAEALEFYKKAFGAKEVSRMPMPDGRLMHAEIRIGDSVVMLADEFPEMGGKSAQTLGGSPVTLNIFVDDCDAMYTRATKSGATGTMPPADMFWGDRYCQLVDPFGHRWAIGTHKEDLSPLEIDQRGKAAMAEMAAGKK